MSTYKELHRGTIIVPDFKATSFHQRPYLVMGKLSSQDYLCLPFTTTKEAQNAILVKADAITGLISDSWVKYHHPITINGTLIHKILGYLDDVNTLRKIRENLAVRVDRAIFNKTEAPLPSAPPKKASDYLMGGIEAPTSAPLSLPKITVKNQPSPPPKAKIKTTPKAKIKTYSVQLPKPKTKHQRKSATGKNQLFLKPLIDGEPFVVTEPLEDGRPVIVRRTCIYQAATSLNIKVKTYLSEDNRLVIQLKED